jgi:hypothetical protein
LRKTYPKSAKFPVKKIRGTEVQFYLGQLIRHFAHPGERQDGAVTLGIEIPLKVEMHFGGKKRP